MTKKTCTKCEVEKNLSDFSKDVSKPDGRHSYCKPCKRIHDKSNYTTKYGAASRERMAARRAANKVAIDEYRLANPCIVCREDSLACLDFHHLDPAGKDFIISSYFAASIETIMAEIAKCVVLCRNCHGKVHKGALCLLP